mgnify:CR=1 FL=1
MASDLPECRNGGPLDMARKLVTYLSDPRAVRRAIKAEYDYGIPCTKTILDLRAAYLRQPKGEEPKPCDAWRPTEASEAARETSQAFVAALDRERALSAHQARLANALNSRFLTLPELVARKFDREADRAWRGNNEL